MNKRVIAVLLIIAVCALSACTLIDNSVDGGREGTLPPLTITDDYLVGMFIVIEDFDYENGEEIYLSPNYLNDKDAIVHYYAQIEMDGRLVSTTVGAGRYLGDIKTSVTNNGTATNGKVYVEATFYYTYELAGTVLRANAVYKRNDKNEYYSTGGVGEYLSFHSGTANLFSSQNIKLTRTNFDGTKEEATYDGSYKINIKFIDYLTAARVIEFDDNNNIIRTHTVNLNESDEYDTLPACVVNCAYVIIEEDYEVRHDNEHYNYPIGARYTERTLYNRASLSSLHSLLVPQGNGFVQPTGMTVSFS